MGVGEMGEDEVGINRELGHSELMNMMKIDVLLS